MTALHTLGVLSTSFTWIAFPTVLKEFIHMLITCWLLFLNSAVQLIPNHLNWVEVGWLSRPGHLMQHSITLLLGQIALIQTGDVLGHCPVEKQIIVPLTANQIGCIAAECLEFETNYRPCHQQSSPTSSHHLLHASRWEPHMHRFTYSAFHKHGWNQKSQIRTPDQRTDIQRSNVVFLGSSKSLLNKEKPQ
jgi:hypothetical protein